MSANPVTHLPILSGLPRRSDETPGR